MVEVSLINSVSKRVRSILADSFIVKNNIESSINIGNAKVTMRLRHIFRGLAKKANRAATILPLPSRGVAEALRAMITWHREVIVPVFMILGLGWIGGSRVLSQKNQE